MRPLYGSALSTMIVVTLGLFLVLYGLVSTIWDQTITRNLPQWFLGDQVTVFGVTLTYEDLITIGCAVVGGARPVGALQVDACRRVHAGRGRRPQPGLTDRCPHQPHRRLRLDRRLHARRAGRDPPRARVRHEHRHPVRVGDLRLRRRHRRALEQPAAHVPGGDDPRGRRVAVHRVRPGQLPQLRHRDPADGTADRRAAPASPVQADRRPRRPPAAPQAGEPALHAHRRRRCSSRPPCWSVPSSPGTTCSPSGWP